MAYLQILNGTRELQVEELNPSASLVVGSGDEAHIRVSDSGVEPRHCQVYPAQNAYWLQDLGAGNTILHMKRLKSTTEGLKQGDIFIVGQTFLKFWNEKPPEGGGAPAAGAASGGGSPAEVAALKRELAAAQAEVQRVQAEAAKASEKAGKASEKVAEADKARREAEAAKRELDLVKKELDTSRSDAARARSDADVERSGREEAEARVKELEGTRDELQEKARKLESELKTTKSDAEAEVATAKADAEQAIARAKADAEAELAKGKADLERQQAEDKLALEATRAELEAWRAEKASWSRDRLAALREGGSDLAKVLDALALPQALRLRLEAAFEDAVDREALRRVAGPVVPLRGLRVPGCDRDLEGELGAARRREEQVSAARALGLPGLDPAELETLLGSARA